MANGYTVTSVNMTQQLDTGGRLVTVITAGFELDNDAGSGEVTVPASGDWQAAAAAAIEAEAGRMLAILNL